MKKEHIKQHLNQIDILRISFTLLLLFNVIVRPTVANARSDFLNYINNTHWDYQNVLILGVGADWHRQLEILEKYHFDKVIPISQHGNVIEDSIKATIEKLGIPMGTLEELDGKNIKNLYIHSWGSSRAVNYLSRMKVGQLNCIGSPESAFANQTLIAALDEGNVGKVFFHINDDDKITFFRHFPKLGLGGGVRGNIEFCFYITERRDIDIKLNNSSTIPIFNVPLGFDKRVFYNCPEKGHGLEAYFSNFSFVVNRGAEGSPFYSKDILPFYTVPSYFVSPASKSPGKSMTEAQTLTEMSKDKHRALIVGKGPEADLMYKNMVKKLGGANVKRLSSYSDERSLQLEASRFGADVILGVRGLKLPEATDLGRTDKQKRDDKYYKNNGGTPPPPPPPPPGQKVGGVCIDPNPSNAGKGGSEIKKGTINSRPSNDSLSWPIEIPKGVK